MQLQDSSAVSRQPARDAPGGAHRCDGTGADARAHSRSLWALSPALSSERGAPCRRTHSKAALGGAGTRRGRGAAAARNPSRRNTRRRRALRALHRSPLPSRPPAHAPQACFPCRRQGAPGQRNRGQWRPGSHRQPLAFWKASGTTGLRLLPPLRNACRGARGGPLRIRTSQAPRTRDRRCLARAPGTRARAPFTPPSPPSPSPTPLLPHAGTQTQNLHASAHEYMVLAQKGPAECVTPPGEVKLREGGEGPRDEHSFFSTKR
jgi:hypothetical protein